MIDAPLKKLDPGSALTFLRAGLDVDAAAAPSLPEINALFHGVSPREIRIVSLRFGLEDGTPQTLAKIASDLNLTPERIRQLESRVLHNLRVRQRRRAGRPFNETARSSSEPRAIGVEILASGRGLDWVTLSLLKKAGKLTLGDLADSTADDLRGNPRIGEGTIRIIETRLDVFGLKLKGQ